jgi:hypothetical protein
MSLAPPPGAPYALAVLERTTRYGRLKMAKGAAPMRPFDGYIKPLGRLVDLLERALELGVGSHFRPEQSAPQITESVHGVGYLPTRR